MPDPDARSLAQRIAGIRRPAGRHGIVSVALLIAILGVGASAWFVTRGSGEPPLNRVARQESRAGVAAAYGYPSRCLSVTLVSAHGRYARADFNHGTPCGRFTGDVTAIFRYEAGLWRPVLEATSYTCPVRAVPADVQSKLDVCPGR